MWILVFYLYKKVKYKPYQLVNKQNLFTYY